MKDLHTVTNESLEARITAWVLGEVSSFEAAELEVICAADPELQLFLNRTKAIHSLMLETPPSSSDHFWKLSPTKREQLDPIIGPNNSSRAIENSFIPRATYRTIFGIAAVLAVTLFIKQFIFSPTKELPLTMASASSESNSEIPATSRMNIDSLNMDLADRKDSDMHQKRGHGSRHVGGRGEENPSAPPVASDASTLADPLALNERPPEPKLLYPSDAETTSEKKTSSAIVPVAPSIAANLSKANPQKRSLSTDASAGFSAEASAPLAQTDKDEATFDLQRKTKPNDALALKSPESHRILNVGQPIEREISSQSSQAMPKQDDTEKDAAMEKRELLSSHSTVAKFIGIKDHECLGKTSLCPDRCGHSGKLATFEIIEYLDYNQPGEYGDPKQTSFQALIRDNPGNAKIPAEILSIIESLKPNTKVKLSWNHDYVTKDKTSFPERPITKIEAEQ